MSVSALMEAMANAGAPLEAILLAVRALEAKDAEIAARRAQAAERKRAERERKRQSRDSHATVTGHVEDTVSNENNSNLPPSEPNGSSGETYRARKAGPFPMPDGVDPQHWRDFLANRKRKNLPNTATAHKRLMDDLSRLADDEWPPGRLIEHAAARGWAAIYDPREQEQQNGRASGKRMGGHRGLRSAGFDDGLSPTTRAAIAVFGPPHAPSH